MTTYAYVNSGRNLKGFKPYPDPAPDRQGVLANWLETVRIVPGSIQANVCDAPFRETAYHRDFNWVWYKRVQGYVRIEGESTRYPCRSGDVFLFQPYTQHTLWCPNRIKPLSFYIHFSTASDREQDLLILARFPMRMTGGDRFLAALSENMAREHALQTPGWRPAIATDIMKGLIHITRHYGSLFHPLPRIDLQLMGRRLQPAIAQMDRSLADPDLSVRALADAVGLSESRFRQLFRTVFQRKPTGFLRARRIAKSTELLRTTGQSAKEIAAVCGFASESYFDRTFKRLMQCTPREYRRHENRYDRPK